MTAIEQSRRTVSTVLAGLTGLALVVVGTTSSGAAARKTTAKASFKARSQKIAATTVATAASATTSPATVVARGKLVFGTIGELPGLDPAAVSRQIHGDSVSKAIYDQLMEVPFGKEPKPSLAQSLTEAADRRSWTLKVRDGVRFHDGTSLTAEAVKLNLERQRRSRIFGASMALIKSIDVIDPMTVRLSIDKPYGTLPYLLGGTVGIMISPKAIAEKGDKLNREPTDAGTGPYVLKEWVPGDRSVVERNPRYWGDPKPRLDQITFRYIPDEGARYLALRAGDLHGLITAFPSTVNQARKDGYRVVDAPLAGSGAVLLNNTKAPFDDVRIRRAAWLALDRRTIGSVFGDPNVDKQGFGLWPKGDPWYSADGETFEYDKAEARKLVAAYVTSTGKDASFTYSVVNLGGVIIDGARLSVRYWQDAGMDVKLQIIPDLNQAAIALATGQYDAAGFVVGLASDPDATAYPVLSSTSPTNFARYKSAEMDALLEEGRNAPDAAAQKAVYAKVQRLFRQDVPFLVTSPGSSHLISDKRVCGLEDSGGFTAKTVGLGNC